MYNVSIKKYFEIIKFKYLFIYFIKNMNLLHTNYAYIKLIGNYTLGINKFSFLERLNCIYTLTVNI
jgi:hypothetical protein